MSDTYLKCFVVKTTKAPQVWGSEETSHTKDSKDDSGN